MAEKTRLNPLDWLISACFGLLSCAIAVTVAVHLIHAVWHWLMAILGIAGVLFLAIRLGMWVHRRQSW